MLPLADIRVLDMTRLLPGNFATLLLVGLGADVVKVEERVGGDGIRQMWVMGDRSESGGHLVLNRGKRSLAIDLKHAVGLDVMLELIATADVLIDSFRPGVLDRLGLTQEALAQANPALVHVSITAFGQTGPYTALPAHDLNTAGYAGALSLVEGVDHTPPMPATQIADLASSMHAAMAVLAGLRVAQRDHASYRADIAMTDSIASMLPLAVATYASTGQGPPVPDLLTGRLACYGMYDCADGLWVTVGGLEPKFFGRMVELMGAPELVAVQYDPSGQSALRERLSQLFAARPRHEWLDLLAGEDTCVGPVLTVPEALRERHFVERGQVTTAMFTDGDTVPVFPATPWAGPMTAEQVDAQTSAPGHGEQTEDVLRESGISQERIADLLAAGIVGPAS